MTSAPFLDRQATTTLIAGALLLAISFFTIYGYGAILRLATLALDEQIGVCLHAAALAALFGVDAVFSVAEGFSKRRSC
jgi:hypothetical protein